MRRDRMISRTLGIGLLFLGIPWMDGISASPDGKPLPGSDLTLHQAVQKADAIVIGSEFHVLMGGGSVVAAYVVDANITECLKGDLPRGKLQLNSIVVRQGEELPLPSDDKGKVDAYLFFTARWEKNGQRGHKVIKMLRTTPENLKAVRNQLSRSKARVGLGWLPRMGPSVKRLQWSVWQRGTMAGKRKTHTPAFMA